MSYNHYRPRKTMRKNGISKEHCKNQLDFIIKYRDEIMEFWEANKHKKGYVKVVITPDYKPYECGFRFIEKRVKKSTFRILQESQTNSYALVHFLWEATYDHYRMAICV
jgi:hypothetical protein